MSNNKQSSVEQFAIALYEGGFLQGNGDEINDLLEQYKAIHKKECVDLLNHHNDIFDTSEEHYSKTFNNNEK